MLRAVFCKSHRINFSNKSNVELSEAARQSHPKQTLTENNGASEGTALHSQTRIFMAFASIHVPDFLVQAVVRAEPALRDRAIALVDGTPPLWNVVAANEAALQAGIQLGMAKSQAAQFCSVEIRQRSARSGENPLTRLCSISAGRFLRAWKTPRRIRSSSICRPRLLIWLRENIANELRGAPSDLGLTAHVADRLQHRSALHAARGFPASP